MRPRAQGFTFIGLLFLITVMGILAAAAASTWSFTSQRDKELDLLFAGRQYRAAIVRYAAAHSGAPQPYPTELAQLLGAKAGTGTARYLRRLYPDPMTGNGEWGLVRNARGGILGVYSLSSRVPVRRLALHADDAIDFAGARTYRDWVFRASLGATAAPPGTPPGWNYERDGAPPLSWENAPAAPQVVPDAP